MKSQKALFALVLLTLSSGAFAHCPASYKPETACLMLDKNMVFIYDQKDEHNGPYKDLEKAEVSGFKSAAGKPLLFKKVARGIFKIESTETQKELTIVVTANKKKSEIKIKHE